LISRVTALGLRIALGLALKIRAGHVVEQKLEAHPEPLAVTLHQMRAQRVLVCAEFVEGAVQPVVVDRARVHAKQIIQRGGVIPVFGHAQLGTLGAEPGGGEQCCGVGPAHRFTPGWQKLAKKLIEPETMPQRQCEVTLAKIATAFHSQRPQVGLLPVGLSVLLGLREARQRRGDRRTCRSFPSQERGQVLPTATQLGQLGPVELAQGSDHPLTRAPGRAHGFAQMPITVTDSTRRLGFTP